MSEKIYYHGSNYKFTTFDKSKIKENKLGLCFNFTDDYSMAYQYGDNILKVHLDLNNPITEDDLDHVLTYEEDLLLCDTMGFPKISKEKFEQEKGRYSEPIGSLYKVFKMKPKFIQFLQKLGYDGVSFPEDHHFGVFEPEQIHIIQNEVKEEKLIPCIIQCRDMEKGYDNQTLEYEGIIRDNVKYKSNIDMTKNWRAKRPIKDLNLYHFLVWHKPGSNKIIDKEHVLNDYNIERLPIENLNEKLEELNDSIYATNSGYDILNWMKNKPRELRIIYDDSINEYFFGDAFNYIHQDILEEAYYQGFYPDMLSSSEARDKVDNYEVTLFAFYPNEGRKLDIEKSSDGYTRKYVYDFGVIYAHEETPLEDCPLYKLLGEPIKKENVFECKTDFKKLNTILEGFIKDYEEVAKIIKDKNGYNVIEDGEVLLDNSYPSLKRMLYDISRNLEE